MINNDLKLYIHNMLTHHEEAVAIDLFFKHDFKFRIISVYLSISNKSHKDSAQEKAIQWIQQALNLNLFLVVLGDFNASTNYISSSFSKTWLLFYLHSINIYDLADHTANQQNTWQSSRYYSKIDYIWIYYPTIQFLTEFFYEDSITITNSDHKILISK